VGIEGIIERMRRRKGLEGAGRGSRGWEAFAIEGRHTVRQSATGVPNCHLSTEGTVNKGAKLVFHMTKALFKATGHKGTWEGDYIGGCLDTAYLSLGQGAFRDPIKESSPGVQPIRHVPT
jgi:hypothetical protein